MKYGAISLDTSIFDQQGINLESGLLKTLEQFKGKPSPLILSEIVLREINSHLVKKISEARTQTTKALRICKSHLILDEGKINEATKLLIPPVDDKEISKLRIEEFINNTGTEIITANGHVDLDDIIKKYFHAEPPFSETGKKKNEFPDAIALMSLESWAKKNNLKILAISIDNDWKSFAEHSEHIDVVKDLADGIAIFQPHNEAVKYCESLAKALPSGKPKEIYSFLEQYLTDSIADIDAYPDASSQFYWEPDIVEINIEEFEFITDDDNQALLQPVQAQENLIVIEAKILINAIASCTFSLAVHDSIDNDYVPMGDASAFIPLEFETEVLFTLEGDFITKPDDIELTEFELLSYPKTIDFGDIVPDWWNEDDRA